MRIRAGGSAALIIREGLALADKAGADAYLENSNPRNTPLYERLGFAAVNPLPLADGAPPLLAMLRPAAQGGRHMKLIGLIGGVSPESTEIYYRLLNANARARLGGEHSANIMVYALDYGVMIKHYHQENWPDFIAEVVKGAKRLAAAGVDGLVICSNTTHVAADAAVEATGLPLIHLQDTLSKAMNAE